MASCIKYFPVSDNFVYAVRRHNICGLNNLTNTRNLFLRRPTSVSVTIPISILLLRLRMPLQSSSSEMRAPIFTSRPLKSAMWEEHLWLLIWSSYARQMVLCTPACIQGMCKMSAHLTMMHALLLKSTMWEENLLTIHCFELEAVITRLQHTKLKKLCTRNY